MTDNSEFEKSKKAIDDLLADILKKPIENSTQALTTELSNFQKCLDGKICNMFDFLSEALEGIEDNSSATSLIENLKNKLLMPMCDNINKNTEEHVSNIVKKISEIKVILIEQQNCEASYISALKKLKWNE